jgi:hypothetical protein
MIHFISIIVCLGLLLSIIRADLVLRAWKDFSIGPESVKGWRISLMIVLALWILFYLCVVFGVIK